MPKHRHRRSGAPDGGVVHPGRALGARMTAEAKPSNDDHQEAAVASPLLGDAVELDIPQEPAEVQEQPPQYFGHATDPGYIDNMDKWGNRPVDQFPKHV
jgi:hypothetical protein